MSQYEEMQVAFQIDGFYFVSSSDPRRSTIADAFTLAKQEVIAMLQRRIDAIEEMTCDRWRQLTTTSATIEE